jgi:hypothetical protein
MPLSKADAPTASKKTASDEQTEEAVEDVLDAGAGAPAGYEEAAEALPEKDEVQKAHKDALLAETGQEEAQAKARIVDASPDAADTPSGAALKEVADIEDNTERGEKYAQVKSAVRWGYVHPSLKSDDK